MGGSFDPEPTDDDFSPSDGGFDPEPIESGGAFEDLYHRNQQNRLGIDDGLEGLDYVGTSLEQFGSGFLQGFTTLDFGEDPETTTGAIARNMGHLFGFIGFIPGGGTVGSMLAKTGVRGLQLASRFGAGAKAMKYGRKGAKAVSNVTSVPMAAGNLVVKGAKKAAQTKAGQSAIKYLHRSPTLKKAFGKNALGTDIAEGFLHMGTAGAASAWQNGADAMMRSFVQTGVFGSVDRVVGNLIPHKGPGAPDLSTLLKGGDNAGRMAARALSLGAFQGLPSTFRGAPLEMQVYQYLMGGYFGGKEISRKQRAAQEFLQPYATDPKKRAEAVGRAQREAVGREEAVKNQSLLFAESLPGYDKLDPEVQEFVKVESDAQFGQFMNLPDDPITQENDMGAANEAQVAAARAMQDTIQRWKEEGRDEEEIQALVDQYRKREAERAQAILRREQREQVSGTDETAGEGRAPEQTADETSENIAGQSDEGGGLGDVPIYSAIGSDSISEPDGSYGAVRTYGALSDVDRSQLATADVAGIRRQFERVNAPARVVSQAVEDHEIPTSLASPVTQFTRELYRENPDLSVAPEKLFVETLTTAKLEWENKGDDGFETFVESVQNRYDLDVSDTAKRELRSQWLRAVHRTPENQISLDLHEGSDPQFVKTPPVDARGIRTARSRPLSHLEQSVGRRAALETVEMRIEPGDTDPRSGFTHGTKTDDGWKGEAEDVTVPIFDAIEHGVLSFGRLTEIAERQGFLLHSGVKDKGRIVATEAPLSKEEAVAYMREQRQRMKEIDQKYGEADGRVSAEEVWRQNYQTFAEQRDLNPKSESTKRSYAYHWANNAKLFEDLNGGRPWAEMYESHRSGDGHWLFRKGVTELNKRMQIIDAGDVPVTSKAWRAIDDIPEGGGLSVALTNGIPSKVQSGEKGGIKYPVEGEDLLTFYSRNDRGEVEESVHDQHVDGIFLLRDDVFDELAEYGGWSSETGSQKGVTAHATEDDGLLIGKYAYHRAGPDMTEQMRQQEMHGIMHDTAAKQIGDRDRYDMRWTKDGELQFYHEGSTNRADPNLYELPDGSMTISQGTGEKEIPKNVRLPVQISSNLNRFQGEDGAQSAWENWHQPGLRGEEIHNQRVSRYIDLQKERATTEDATRQKEIDNDLETIAENLDPEKVGVEEAIDFFYAPTQSAGPVYEKMARHVLNLDPEDVMPQAYDTNRIQRDVEKIAEQKSAANMIVEAAGEVTPAITNHKLVRPYFESALRGWLTTKVMRPKLKHSWKSIMTPYHDDLQVKHDLGRDEFLLHKGMREKPVQWGEETIPLGKAWDRFQEAGGWESAPSWMQSDMTMVAMRAPADSISGTRPMRFKGFTDRKGTGATMHPKSMEYLGGADLDIDSAFFFQSFPEGVMNTLYRNRKEWETTERLEDGTAVDVLKVAKNKDEDFVQRFSDDPEENARLEGVQEHPISVHDPIQRLEAGMGANRGNKLLGFGLNAAKRWHVIAEENGAVTGRVDEIPKRLRKKIRKELGDVSPDDLNVTWTGYLKEDQGRTIRDYKRDIVNYAADAANYAGLISRFEIADLVGRKAMKRIQVRATTEDDREVEVGYYPQHEQVPFSVSRNDQYRGLAQADKFLKGKDYENAQAFSLEEVIGGLQEAQPNIPKGVTNTWYRLGRELGSLNKPEGLVEKESPVLEQGRYAAPPYLGDQYFKFKQAFDRIWEEDSPAAEIARRMIVRKEVKVFTEQRDWHPAQAYEAAQPEGRETPIARPRNEKVRQQAKDFPVNDLTDVVSTIEAYRIGRKMVERYGKEEAARKAEELATHAYQTRKDAARMLGKQKKRQQERLAATSREDELSQVIEEAHAYAEQLSPLEREYYETYMMGSLRPQTATLSGRQSRKQLLQQHEQVRGTLDQAEGRQERQRLRKELEEINEQLQQDKKEWYETNQSGSSMMLGVVRQETMRNFLNRYNDVVQATRKKNLTEQDVREQVLRATSADKLAEKVEAAGAGNDSAHARHEADKWVRETFDQLVPSLVRADGELSPRAQAMKERLETLFYNDPRLMRDFETAAPDIVGRERQFQMGTEVEAWTIQDLESYVRFFDYAGKHDPWSIPADEREELPLELKRRHYFLFPETFDKKHLPYDRGKVTLEQPVVTRSGEVEKGEVDRYLSRIGQIHQFWKTTHRQIDQQTNAEEAKLIDRFEIIESLGREGQVLWDAAVAIRERQERGDKEHYSQEYQRAMQRLEDEGLRTKEFEVQVDGRLQKLTGMQIIERVNQEVTRWSKEMYQKYVRNDAASDFLVYKDGQDGIPDHEKALDVRATLAKINEQVLRGRKPPILGFDALSRLSHQYLLNKVEVDVTRFEGDVSTRDRELWAEYGESAISRIPDEVQQRVSDLGDRVIEETVRLGDIEDPQLRRRKREEVLSQRDDLKFEPTGQRDFNKYWPHNGHPQKAVEDAIKSMIESNQVDGVAEPLKDQTEVAAKIEEGRMNAPDGGAMNPERMEQFGRRSITQEEIQTKGLKYKPGHLMSRGSWAEGTIPGYRRDIEALSTYQRQVVTAHYKMVADLMSRTAIDSFRDSNAMGEYTEAWSRFMQIYNRDQIGMPSIFPESWLQDPKMKLGTASGSAVASNPYYWFTDDSIQKKAVWLGRKLGFDADKYGEIESKKETRQNLSGTEKLGSYFGDGELMSQKIRQFSQWEGKWQLMSLLAHTKSYVNNIVGGNIHTAVNAGMRPWRKAKDIGYIRNFAGIQKQDSSKAVESWGDVRDFIEQHGGVENWIVNEISMSRRFRTDKLKNFADDVVRAVQKDPQVEDATLKEMADRRGISDTILNGAAFFMRKSERQLRTRSFMAHYLKARETLGMGGSNFAPDHPWLIRQANKGVEATQFLYQNSARPAFARTPLGRIFSRFQMFTWNAVRFRRRVFQQAERSGWQRTGSPTRMNNLSELPPPVRRAQRLMAADLMVLGLASFFPFSLFDSNVPPHIEWATNLSNLIFGDEQEQENAFFGTGELGPLAPLQAIQPPSTRFIQPAFIAMMNDDWSRFVDYHIPVMMPFGRLGRNTYRAYQNPIRVSEEMTGVPIIKAQEKLPKRREKERVDWPMPMDPWMDDSGNSITIEDPQQDSTLDDSEPTPNFQ